MVLNETELLELEEKAAHDEVMAQVLLEDPVLRSMRRRQFVSRSKGIRNGKRRYRRHWKEVDLIHYKAIPGRWFTWRKFPFDKYAQEILGDHYRSDYPEHELQERCNNLTRWLGVEW